MTFRPCSSLSHHVHATDSFRFAPDFSRTLFVAKTTAMPAGNTYQLGCRLHSLLRRMSDHSPLSADEKSRLPWLNLIRDELRSHGVRCLEPEVRLAVATLPVGRCDLLLTGGLTKTGVAEMKVTSRLPEVPEPGHVQQLVRYADLIGHQRGEAEVWGTLIYVHERCVRFFIYRNCRLLRDTTPLLAA